MNLTVKASYADDAPASKISPPPPTLLLPEDGVSATYAHVTAAVPAPVVGFLPYKKRRLLNGVPSYVSSVFFFLSCFVLFVSAGGRY